MIKICRLNEEMKVRRENFKIFKKIQGRTQTPDLTASESTANDGTEHRYRVASVLSSGRLEDDGEPRHLFRS